MDGVSEDGGQGLGGREVVAETSNGVGSAASGVIPDSEQVYKEVSSKLDAEHLRYHVEIGDQRGLEDDGDVGGVEQLDGVRERLSTGALAVQLELNAEAL